MNVAFTLIALASLIALTIISPETAFPTMISGVRNAILLMLKLAAIYTVWLGVLKMMEKTKIDKALSRLLRPVVKRLFKKESDEAYDFISVNLASNMLGMGGAATPAGIKAIGAMTADGERATDNMILLVVINATSIQLIPATVISIRAAAGSANSANIFLPTLIATFVSTATGVILCKILSLKSEKTTQHAVKHRSSSGLTGVFANKRKEKASR
ncbi:MAG: spore maturation protein [Clostridia bacterium]|nr:spore maturation protein [Clostridia bacterium]